METWTPCPAGQTGSDTHLQGETWWKKFPALTCSLTGAKERGIAYAENIEGTRTLYSHQNSFHFWIFQYSWWGDYLNKYSL
ncbi:hypothetical protein Mapa_010878 [Marchantia paleacea]|nr:hypothetical protein Mapa_010878 [Marchantia paleacea]